MSCHDCGCDSARCGCCDGVATLTPASVANRPALPALAWRVGTHGRFLASMKARLPLVEVLAPGADNQTLQTFRPLQSLTTRDPADPAIALLDAWATVADVLGFYQERIANEGYVRTATERRSLVELSRLVGYVPRPGVSSSVFLSYTVDDHQAEPVELPAGTRAQSIPGPDELPQSFETAAPLLARREWNDLTVRRQRPQRINGDTVSGLNVLHLAGTDHDVQPGDLLLFRFGGTIDGASAGVDWVRKAVKADTDFAAGSTRVRLQPIDWLVQAALPALAQLVARLSVLTGSADADRAHAAATRLLDNQRLGVVSLKPLQWAVRLRKSSDAGSEATQLLGRLHEEILRQSPPWLLAAALPLLRRLADALGPAAARDPGSALSLALARTVLAQARTRTAPPVLTWPDALRGEIGIEDGEAMRLMARFEAAIASLADGPPRDPSLTSSPDGFVDALLQPPVPQAANALRLRRELGRAFDAGAGVQPQLLLDFAPRLRDSYYAAWRGAAAPASPSPLAGVFLLRAGERLFGAGAARQTLVLRDTVTHPEWLYADDEDERNAFLGRTDDLLTAGDLVLVQQRVEDETGKRQDPEPVRQVLTIQAALGGPRTAYGMSADATMLEFDAPWRRVGTDDSPTALASQQRLEIDALRSARVYPQKAVLALADEPVDAMVAGTEIELGPLHEDLQSGRWVVVEGERADIPGVRGVRASELMMVAGLQHGYDPTLPGDPPHTTLRLATPLANAYYRDGLRIHGNVVAASHGETRTEVLGNGDARQPMQRFVLRQPPLTWRPAPAAAGAASTLRVLVNDVEWQEVDTLAGQAADARAFVTWTDDDGRTSVTFGDGHQGARPPSGFGNIRAEYRNGIGQGGNVRAGQVALLVTRPLGVKDVVNPLRASGGADRESAGLIRENAPRSLMALDRLVSVSDYADFTRMYAGIAKAAAVRLGDGGRERVHITIAGIDDIAIDEDSDLYRNLLESLRLLGDPALPVQVAARERIALVLQARLRLLPGHRWEPVATAVRATLLQRFGFQARALAQPALLCEIVAAMQSVRGVDWVDVDSFGGIPQTVLDPETGLRRLIRQDEITRVVAAIVGTQQDANPLPASAPSHPGAAPPARVEAGPAIREGTTIRPARLACFVPDVADTLILNPVQ